jgi:hypothetical protein
VRSESPGSDDQNREELLGAHAGGNRGLVVKGRQGAKESKTSIKKR